MPQLKTGQDIRVDHDNDPDILGEFVNDITEAGKGFARGVTTDLVGAPVDLISGVMRAAGVPIPDNPTLSSGHLRKLAKQPAGEPTTASKFGNTLSLLANPEALGAKLVGAAGIMVGIGAKDAARVESMHKNGFSRKQILKKTGLHISPTGKARKELFDNKAQLTPDARVFNSRKSKESGQTYPTMDKFMTHDTLYTDSVLGEKMRNTRVKVTHQPEKEGNFVRGSFSYDDNLIEIHIPKGATDRDVIETVLHEAQHKVQDLQGLEMGANFKGILIGLTQGTLKGGQEAAAASLRKSGQFSNESIAEIMYWGMAGEIEARAVATRYRLTDQQLRDLPIQYDRGPDLTFSRGNEL